MTKTLSPLIKILATGFGSGYAPFAPGTFGTVVGVLIYLLLKRFNMGLTPSLVFSVFVISVVASHLAESVFHSKDCQKIVIDEICGLLICYALIVPTQNNLILGFVLFRIFDMIKIFPASWCQDHLPGGLGVVMDDVAVGLQAAAVIRVLAFLM